MLSRTSGYAIHATLHIAARAGPDNAVPAASVAEALDIPSNYLAKILNTLAREGILASERGRTGGFRLARDPEEITLLDVVEHFDDIGFLDASWQSSMMQISLSRAPSSITVDS